MGDDGYRQKDTCAESEEMDGCSRSEGFDATVDCHAYRSGEYADDADNLHYC